MTVNAYINHLRIREAKQLIERTDIPLTEIYRQVGYKTNQNFSKQFTKQIGLAPPPIGDSSKIRTWRKISRKITISSPIFPSNRSSPFYWGEPLPYV